MQRFLRLATLLMLTTLAIACTAPQATEPAAGSGADASPIVDPSESPTEAPDEEETAPVDSPEPSPIPRDVDPEATVPFMTPTFVPTPTAVTVETPLAGVVYRTPEGLWQIGSGGEAAMLAPTPDLDLSPDGTQGIYIQNGDVWILDLVTLEARNVTEGSGREHVHAQWWPARPQTLVLGSWGENDPGPNDGRLTLVETDGSNYRVIHEEGDLSFAMPAPAPDGQTIAYDEAGQPMIYHIDNGVSPFDPYAYGVAQEVEVQRGASPSWSPDGNRLAWVMGVNGGGYGENGNWEVVVGVFDLQAQNSQLLHPFPPVGRGGWFRAPLWRPDGQWMTVLIESENMDEYGLWALAANGSAEQQLNQGTSAQGWWSPPGDAPWQNGRRLLLGVSQPEGGMAYTLIDPTTWEETPVSLPPNAMAQAWRTLP